MRFLATFYALTAVLWAAPLARGNESPDTAVAGVKLWPVSPAVPRGDAFAVFLSGDGGWAALDRAVANDLAAAGIPVVGFDSLSYFWKRRTPEETAQTVDAVVARYRRRWKMSAVILIGYSRGADVLPFVVTRLPEDTVRRLRLVCLLAPAEWIDFEFHLTDWLHGSKPRNALPVVPEIEKLKEFPLLVLYGRDDHESCGARLDPSLGTVIALPGDHHFARDYARISELIRQSAAVSARAKRKTP